MAKTSDERREDPGESAVDWKLIGYSISSLSVLLLGATALPFAKDSEWQVPTIVAGMIASILGMVCRYISHRQEKAAIAYAKREAERSN